MKLIISSFGSRICLIAAKNLQRKSVVSPVPIPYVNRLKVLRRERALQKTLVQGPIWVILHIVTSPKKISGTPIAKRIQNVYDCKIIDGSIKVHIVLGTTLRQN